jgi:uncharacterized protein (DUF1501 family)
MGNQRDPWIVSALPFNANTYGAIGEYEFHHEKGRTTTKDLAFRTPNLSLPEGQTPTSFRNRLSLLKEVDRERRALEEAASVAEFDRHRTAATTLLLDKTTRGAFDVQSADEKLQERYGKNSFGWSLLMARRLVEAGVNLVQVNLGNNESWDTHGEAFPHLKDKLLPPTDRSLSALLDDLHESGLLDDTLIVMAGEFGRTPKITHLPQYYKLPGRDHWGAVQTVFFAGGGVRGGQVIGSSDRIGGYPASSPQTPENMAASIYRSLGIPATAAWHDEADRPHHIYNGVPIEGLA